MASTDAERKAAQRARQKSLGLEKLELWLPTPLHEKVKRYAARLLRSKPPIRA